MPQVCRMDKLDNSLEIELGIPTSQWPCHDHDLAQTATSFAAITHARPYPPASNSQTACPSTGNVAQIGEPISPLDLNDRKESLANLADLFEAYVIIPRIRPTSSCLDLDLSPRSKPALSKSSRSLDDIRSASPSTEFHRYEHDHIACLNISKAATAI